MNDLKEPRGLVGRNGQDGRLSSRGTPSETVPAVGYIGDMRAPSFPPPARGVIERDLPVRGFFKTCVYCGRYAMWGRACPSHKDLLKYDPYYSKVTTTA